MFVFVYDFNRPHWMMFNHRLSPRAKLDPFRYARLVDGNHGRSIDWNLFSFDGHGDFIVEFRRCLDSEPLMESQTFYWVRDAYYYRDIAKL